MPAYTWCMVDPSPKPRAGKLVPHPDDEGEVRAGLEESQRDEVLSAEEAAAYLRELLGDERPET